MQTGAGGTFAQKQSKVAGTPAGLGKVLQTLAKQLLQICQTELPTQPSIYK